MHPVAWPFGTTSSIMISSKQVTPLPGRLTFESPRTTKLLYLLEDIVFQGLENRDFKFGMFEEVILKIWLCENEVALSKSAGLRIRGSFDLRPVVLDRSEVRWVASCRNIGLQICSRRFGLLSCREIFFFSRFLRNCSTA